MKKQNEQLVGAHVSIAGGLHKSVAQALELGATTMQIFTKSNRSYKAKPLTQEEIDTFRQAVKESGLQKPVAHCSYLINIGSPKEDVAQRSTAALTHELERCQQLGIPYLVLHPGSHLKSGEDECITRIAKNLDKVLEIADGTTTICLETMAGQGTNIGYAFEHLRAIIDQCENNKHLGVCFDTCHVFAAGYNITTQQDYDMVMKQFKDIIGVRRLKVFHINDSKMPLGAKRDRHASLGEGEIPKNVFSFIMNDEPFTNVPKILETPDPELYAKEIKELYGMIS